MSLNGAANVGGPANPGNVNFNADAVGNTIANAMRRNAKNVIYADFKPKEDFSLWLAGYREKIRNAFGYDHTQNVEVNEEVVRSISGKLQCGTALDAYNSIPPADKVDYDRLVERLTGEFIDPQEQQRFLEDFAYNKRTKGQTLAEFMQQIKKDQNKYSGMKDVITVGAAQVANTAKIHNGIRRFKKGIRSKEGLKDKGQVRHLQYNLHKTADLTWENALEVASRWEAANTAVSSSSSSSSSSSDDPLEAVECEKKKRKKRKGKADAKMVVINAVETPSVLATLADRVETNERDIKGVRSEQERISANITSWREENASTLDKILKSVESLSVSQSLSTLPENQQKK